jgi:hypothetical protein
VSCAACVPDVLGNALPPKAAGDAFSVGSRCLCVSVAIVLTIARDDRREAAAYARGHDARFHSAGWAQPMNTLCDPVASVPSVNLQMVERAA